MKKPTRFAVLGPLAAALLGGCGDGRSDVRIEVRPIASPAEGDCAEPNLIAGDDGILRLSWVERTGETRTALRYASLGPEGWTDASTIAEGEDWFVNWADFPSLGVFPGGGLAAHWLAKTGGDTYAYGIQVSRSPEGSTWSDPMPPHRDGTPTEHGFVSMAPWGEDRLVLAWLDGRKTVDRTDEEGRLVKASREMTLRSAQLRRDGSLSVEVELDGRVCDCCATAAVRTRSGIVVAYRDRSVGEVRDISYVRLAGGEWSAPRPLAADGWEIPGCPVNGPALDATEEDVAVAWFTQAGDEPRVKVAFSSDEGETFGKPIWVDDGEPLGRVDLVMLPDRSVLVCWLEATEEDAEIRVRHVTPDRRRSDSFTVTASSGARASGFPRMARVGERIFFAWTVPEEPSRVQVAEGRLISNETGEGR